MKKYIVVTGASSGIGSSYGKSFARRGENLIVIARGETEQNYQKNLREVRCNISPDSNVIVNHVISRSKTFSFGMTQQSCELKALINNAGFGDFGFMGNHDIQKMVKMIDLNVTALAILSSLFVRDYKCKQTQLINVSSVGGYFLAPRSSTHIVSTKFLCAFTEGIFIS